MVGIPPTGPEKMKWSGCSSMVVTVRLGENKVFGEKRAAGEGCVLIHNL